MSRVFDSTIFTLSGTTPSQYKKMVNTEDFSLIDLSKVTMTNVSMVEMSGHSIEPDTLGNIIRVERKANSSYMVTSDCIEESDNKVHCWFCREKMGTWKEGVPVGTKSKDVKGDGINVEVYRYGYFCDDVCTYWYCLDKKNTNNRVVRTQYEEAIKLLKSIRSMRGATVSFPEYSPWENLKYNGGALEYGQWKSKVYTFKRLPGYVNCRTKCTYIIGS